MDAIGYKLKILDINYIAIDIIYIAIGYKLYHQIPLNLWLTGSVLDVKLDMSTTCCCYLCPT